MMKKLISLLIIVCVFALHIPTNYLMANAQSMGDTFSVRPLLPKNQDSDINNYFSLTTKENSIKQNLEFVVTNVTNKELIIDIFPLNGLTSPSGEIQYTKNKEEENSKLLDDKYSLGNYVEPVDSITIAPKGKKTVTVKLNVDSLTGTLLGSIGFQERQEKETNKEQFGIISEYMTVIGVLVKLGEPIEEDFSVDRPIIHPMSDHFTMKLPLSLNSPNLIKNSQLTYEVLDHNRKRLFGSNEPKKINFAPKSESSFFLPWNLDKIAKNKTYTLVGDVNYTNIKNEGDVFHFEIEFKYLEEEYLGTNNDSGIKIPTLISSNWKYIIPFGLLLLFALLALLLYRSRKDIYVLNSEEPSTTNVIELDDELINYVFPIKDLRKNRGFSYSHFYKAIIEDKEIIRLQYIKTKNNKK